MNGFLAGVWAWLMPHFRLNINLYFPCLGKSAIFSKTGKSSCALDASESTLLFTLYNLHFRFSTRSEKGKQSWSAWPNYKSKQPTLVECTLDKPIWLHHYFNTPPVINYRLVTHCFTTKHKILSQVWFRNQWRDGANGPLKNLWF